MKFGLCSNRLCHCRCISHTLFSYLSFAHLTIHPLHDTAPWSCPTRPSWRWKPQRPPREKNKTRMRSRLAPSQPTPPSGSWPRSRRSRSQQSSQPKVRARVFVVHASCMCFFCVCSTSHVICTVRLSVSLSSASF